MSVDWQARYLARDTPWEKGAASPPLRAWLNRHPGIVRRRRILVPGCGWGHDARIFARAGADVTGLDVAPAAVTRARALTGQTDGACRFVEGDLLDGADAHRAGLGPFDDLVEHTLFCAIDPSDRDAYVAACERHIAPGGRLIGLFFPDTGNAPDEGPPFPCTQDELIRRFNPGFCLRAAWRPAVGYPGRVGCEYLMLWERRTPTAPAG